MKFTTSTISYSSIMNNDDDNLYFQASDATLVIDNNNGNNDVLSVPVADPNVVIDYFGYDTLSGSQDTDYLYGGSGDDFLFGWDGDDYLYGGLDNDILEGGQGEDWLYGGSGDDELRADIYEGNDHLFGGKGNDEFQISNMYSNQNPFADFEINGGTGIDTLDFFLLDYGVSSENGVTINLMDGTGSAENFTMTITGVENIFGTDQRDELTGDIQNNILQGDGGADTLNGGGGNDLLYAGTGDDFLRGGDGDDVLYGGNGDDWFNGGSGNDILNGGENDDIFYFNHHDNGEKDIIRDFEPGQDTIVLSDTEVHSWKDLMKSKDGDYMEQVGNDTVIHSSDNDTITLVGIEMSDLSSSDFIF